MDVLKGQVPILPYNQDNRHNHYNHNKIYGILEKIKKYKCQILVIRLLQQKNITISLVFIG